MLAKSWNNMILDEAFLSSYQVSEQRHLKRQTYMESATGSHNFPRHKTEVRIPSNFLCIVLLFCHDGHRLNSTVVFS